jgi:hypothetical protein
MFSSLGLLKIASRFRGSLGIGVKPAIQSKETDQAPESTSPHDL